jgi:hypothetical protein
MLTGGKLPLEVSSAHKRRLHVKISHSSFRCLEWEQINQLTTKVRLFAKIIVYIILLLIQIFINSYSGLNYSPLINVVFNNQVYTIELFHNEGFQTY